MQQKSEINELDDEDLLMNMAFDETKELNARSDKPESKKEKDKKKLFGIDDINFFYDLFMPKDSNFQNKVVDLTVESDHFIYFPFVYPEVSKLQTKE